ncbi:hypothetical protein PNA2_0100 [Pyrococcus sp. NA2]|uniref:DUF835 domain-containing protein n=1 Tax=Pyrococcus sp. (strain NA2) TaxID=342949 RepID=UPI000209AE42|nr:DUF835 domain-containing protein [Pyrococcus sp. NA2]AEC51018.1 hypothetical protein PNA2_0100 [Pyrococcus sp. NA2]
MSIWTQLLLGTPLLVVYVILFYHYYVYDFEPLLYYALSFLAFGIGVMIKGAYLASLAFFSSTYLIATVRSLNDQKMRILVYVSPVPLATYIFFIHNEVLVLLTISATLILSGLLLTLKRNLRIIGYLTIIASILIILGNYVSLMLYMLSPFMVGLGYLLITTFNIDLIRVPVDIRERFELKPGVMFLPTSPKEILDVALVFSKNPGKGKRWFWITKVKEEKSNTIEPTNLPKILDLAIRYMKKGGVVVIDCLEYLIIENGFEAVLRFLAQLRDHAILNNSTVIIVGNLEGLSKREVALLKRSLGEENV